MIFAAAEDPIVRGIAAGGSVGLLSLLAWVAFRAFRAQADGSTATNESWSRYAAGVTAEMERLRAGARQDLDDAEARCHDLIAAVERRCEADLAALRAELGGGGPRPGLP